MTEGQLRERICLHAKSIYDRGLTHGSTGNISVRLEDGGWLLTPTGSCFGMLDPARLSRLDAEGRLIGGDSPTKECPLHLAFYQLGGRGVGAIVHLHSHYSVALSMMNGVDPGNAIPPLTPYTLMQLGRVRLLPYMRPGDPKLAEAVQGLEPHTRAIILANHGPVVAMPGLDAAVWAMDELEASARLALEVAGRRVSQLTDADVAELVRTFDLD